MLTLERRNLRSFIRAYSVEDKNGCWIWVLGTSGGYGRLKIGRKNYRAHRLSLWAFEKLEDIDDTELISRHQCGNKLCVNPEHLEVGDHHDNYLDSVKFLEPGAAAESTRREWNKKGHVFDLIRKFNDYFKGARGPTTQQSEQPSE